MWRFPLPILETVLLDHEKALKYVILGCHEPCIKMTITKLNLDAYCLFDGWRGSHF